MPKLLVEKGNNRNASVVINIGQRITAGRERDNDLQLFDIMSSRKHFSIYSEGKKFFIEDKTSSNGTFVNGMRITKQLLHIGDKVQVGETLMSFLDDKESSKEGGLVGKDLAGYRIEERLGRGAMGTVYKAVQKSLERVVALKILASELLKNKDFIDMFVKEARSCGQLNHPNIIQVYDVGDYKGVWFFSMEYAEQGSVADKIQSNQKLPLKDAISMIIDACNGLEYAEKKGIIHRDIKPDNLFVCAEDTVKLGDLGLATRADDIGGEEGVFGTPHYIAPEQALGQQIDHRADIYALGATFYRMITGETAYEGANVREVLRKQVKEPPPNAMYVDPTIPRQVNDIIKKMMAKDVKDRYQSATDVIKALEKAQKLLNMPVRALKPAAGMNNYKKGTAGLPSKKSSLKPRVEKTSSAMPIVIGIVVLLIVAAVIAFAVSKKKDKTNNRIEYDKPTTIIPSHNNPTPPEIPPVVDDNPAVTDDDDDDVAASDDDETINPRDRLKAIQRLRDEIDAKISGICKNHDLENTRPDNFTTLNAILVDFEKLKLEYDENELIKSKELDNPVQFTSDNLQKIIAKMKTQMESIDTEFIELEKAIIKATEETRYKAALDEYDAFLQKFNGGAWKEYDVFVRSKVNAFEVLKYTKLEEIENAQYDLVNSLRDKFTALDKNYTKAEKEILMGKDFEIQIEKLDKEKEPYQVVVANWGIKEYEELARNKIAQIDAKIAEIRNEINKQISEATVNFENLLIENIRQAFKLAVDFKYVEINKNLEDLKKSKTFKLCYEQIEKDKKAEKIIDVFKRIIDQFKYAQIFMDEFDKELNKKVKMSKPDFISDDEISSSTISITGYEDGILEIKAKRGSIKVALKLFNTPDFATLVDKTLNIKREKDVDILIGAAVVFLIRSDSESSLFCLKRALSECDDKKMKCNVREYMVNAIYAEIERLSSEGKGKEARSLLERLKRDFSDTKAFKELADPPIDMKKIFGDPTPSNEPKTPDKKDEPLKPSNRNF